MAVRRDEVGTTAAARPTLARAAGDFPAGAAAFLRFTRGAAWRALRELGLLEIP